MKNILLLFALLAAFPLAAQQPAYEIWFTAGQVRHHGLLLPDASPGEWLLRVQYQETPGRSFRLIEQRMAARETRLGLCLQGKQVWDVQRRRPATDYAADNFYFLYDSARRLYPQNRDNSGAQAALTVQPLDETARRARMREFGL